MSGVNKVIIVGRLGTDPEIRYTTSGVPVGRLSIATSEKWTDKNTGEKQERTEWHKVVVWNKLAELCGQYLKKGRQVYIEGRLQTRAWDDKEGHKRYTTEVRADTIQFLGGPGTSTGVQSDVFGGEPAAPTAGKGATASEDNNPFSGEEPTLSDEDIPF